jgi:hypothetical protein
LPETTEGQRAEEAEASEPVTEDAELPRSVTRAFSLVAFLLTVLLSGCGNSGSSSDDFSQRMARDFKRDCLMAPSPNEAMKAHLGRLCSCTEKKIAATPMQWGESEVAINEKIKAAMNVCYSEVGGAPGEGRGKAGRSGA